MSSTTERVNGHPATHHHSNTSDNTGAAAGGTAGSMGGGPAVSGVAGVVRRAGLSPLVAGVPAPGVAAAAAAPARYVPAPAGQWPGGVMAPRPVQGPVVRASLRKARRGWYAPVAAPAPTTTRQAEILNPALVASPTDDEGVAIGRDLLSNSPVAHDPFTAYQRKELTSPSVIAIGLIGSGKSSLLKTVYVLRPIILRGRRVVTLDRKDRAGEGEYCELTRLLGGQPFSMRIGGGGTVINPLDPQITAVIGRAGQFRLLRAMAERANNNAALDKWEAEALRVAHAATLVLAEYQDRVPLMADLVGLLGGVPKGMDASPGARERLHQAGLGVKFLLTTILSNELAGLFDGPTSAHVRLDAKLTTFDISQLPEDGPATAMVLAVAHAWLLGSLRRDRGHGTNFIVEEGWDMVTGPIGRQMNANQMLARGLGLCNVAALHHVAQVRKDAEALSLLREPQTVHIFQQDKAEDITACVEMYGLNPQSADTLATLKQGQHLLKIGTRREIHVRHDRSPLEVALTDTDGAMNVGATARQTSPPFRAAETTTTGPEA